MNEQTRAQTIRPGMSVYGSDGETLGQVESVGDDGYLRVLAHAVPAMAIARVDDTGVHLHVAKAAFAAAPPDTRDDTTTEM